MPNRWKEREDAIVNGIMSLVVNECNIIECLNARGPAALAEEVTKKVRPTLQVCAGEARQTESDLAASRVDSGHLRAAVETVIANQDVPPSSNDIVMQALRVAAPGHPHLV